MTRENLIRNGSFEQVGPDDVAGGWTLTSAGDATAAVISVSGADGRRCQRISSDGKAAAVLAQRVSVQPRGEYFFSVRMRCDDRVVVQIGTLSMAYTELGEWQTLVGTIRTVDETAVTVDIRLGGYRARPNTLHIDDVQLRPTRMPALPDRPQFAQTSITTADGADAAIVYPAALPEYRTHAEAIQAAIRDKTGIDVPLVADTDATAAKSPTLTPEFRDRPLILLGRLGINRVLWTPYNRFLAAVDGYYPGGDGYVVRTAANVLRNGRNHIIVGGSSEAGAARAVARFIDIVRQIDPAGDQGLVLPWLLDVELGGDCRDRFDARRRIWDDDPEDELLHPVEPGYGTVIRWYENAMSWYWTGWESYRQRARELIAPVLTDKTYTHHYVIEFFIRTYTMIHASDLLTAEQRAGVDNLILQNFWEFLFGVDGTWMTTFAPPYDEIRLTNRHAVGPWMADMVMADFLHDHFDLKGELAALVGFRRHEKHRFWEYMVAERWGASHPAIDADHDTEICETFFRYALENEQYVFFSSDNARRTLRLDQLDHVSGMWTRSSGPCDHELMLGMLASYYQDGRYKSLRETIPLSEHPRGPFMMRYVCGVHKYTPGSELAAADPDDLAGVRVPRMMPHDRGRLTSIKANRHRPVREPEKVVECVTFRSGFDADDDFVTVNGLARPAAPGVFLGYRSHGTDWLSWGGTNAFGPGTDRYFDQNAVHVLRTDTWLTDEQPYAAAAVPNWIARLDRAGGVSMTMDPFMETRWRRDIVWIRPGLCVVRDAITANADGEFTIAVNWRPNGEPRRVGDSLECVTDTGRMRITALSDTLELVHNLDAFEHGEATYPYFRQTASGPMQAGDAVTATAVLQTRSACTDPVYQARLVQPNAVLLEGDAVGGSLAVLWPPVDIVGIRSDAAVLVMATDHMLAIEATSVHVDDVPILATDERGSHRIALPHPGINRLDTHLAAISAMPSVTAGDATGLQIHAGPVNRTAQWRPRWTYAGLQRPRRIPEVKRIADDIVDLGADVALAEIRAINTNPRFWFVCPLPVEIWTAADTGGDPPPTDSPLWHKLETPYRWRPSVETGNYGKAVPVAEANQFVQPENLVARFVRAENAPKLLYYDAGTNVARRPLRVEAGTFDDEPRIFVHTDTWPPFIKRRDQIDDSLALLTIQGEEIFRFHEPTTMQAARILELEDGRSRIVEVADDAKVRIFARDGTIEETVDLYAMHQQFNETYGRTNTRHPAGGLTMPYAVGLWRPDADGRRRMIVTRYGTLSFLDQQRAFEGVLASGGYTNSTILPYGIDFDGDGIEEQLVLNCNRLFRIGGSGDPVIHDPDGHYFYPQVYASTPCDEPDPEFKVDGALPIQFHGIIWGGGSRYVLVVRDSYLGIYDGADNRFAFTWTPTVKFAAAAAIVDEADTLRVLAQTCDDLLWDLSWHDHLDQVSVFRTQPLPGRINRIAPYPAPSGAALLAGSTGLYLLSDDELQKIANGDFNDACALTAASEREPAVIAATRDGRVMLYEDE